MEMPSAFVTSIAAVSRELHSARPDAPVVPHVEPAHRVHALRLAAARGLHRVASAVEPAERHRVHHPEPAC